MSSREAALRAIAGVPKWHHKMELLPGVWTPGLQDTPSMLPVIGFPTDCTGMRVLDIGARDGFFSFEAERRGATEVIALDYEPPTYTGFAVAADILGSKVRYVTGNVYGLNEEEHGRFDLVLFLGVIYHLRHPLLALDRVRDVCAPEALMLIETHMIDEGLVDAEGNWRRMTDFHPDLAHLPLAQYFPGSMLGSDPTSQWAPTQAGLRAWLEGAGFDVVSDWRVAFRGGATGRASRDGPPPDRAIDEAAQFDMARWTIEKPGRAPTAGG